MRRKIVLSGIAVVIAFSTLIGYKSASTSAKENNNIVTVENIEEHSDRWLEFTENATNGKKDKIEITMKNISSNIQLECDDHNITYIDGTEKKQYKYLLDLEGKMPMASKEGHFVVLANKQYTFDDIALSTYSNDSEKACIEYELIYCY